MDRVEGQLEPVGNAQLVENVVQVVLDGLLADEQLLPDLFVAETLGDELHDFLLAIAEKGLFASRAGLGDLENYVSLAVAKAADLDALVRLRASLRGRVAGSVIGDPIRYTRAAEAAYREMWQRWCAGK